MWSLYGEGDWDNFEYIKNIKVKMQLFVLAARAVVSVISNFY